MGSNLWKSMYFKHRQALFLERGVMFQDCTMCCFKYTNVKKKLGLTPCVPWVCCMYRKTYSTCNLSSISYAKKNQKPFCARQFSSYLGRCMGQKFQRNQVKGIYYRLAHAIHHDSYLSIIPLPCPISLIDLILSMPDVYASSNLTLTKTFFKVVVILEKSNSIIIDYRHHLKIFLQKAEKRQYLTIWCQV